MSTILIILIILLLCGSGYGFQSGNHYLGGVLGLVILILVILAISGRI